MARRVLPPELRERALALLRLPEAERPFEREIAAIVGVHLMTVKRWARAEGALPGRRLAEGRGAVRLRPPGEGWEAERAARAAGVTL